MRILFLSLYFDPDLCAGAFRNTAVARALHDKLGPGDDVDVITSIPNRYHSFVAKAPLYESAGNLRIHRIPLPLHKSGVIDQSRAFISYALGAIKVTNKKQYDLVYASSSRLMTGVLGAYLARRKEAPFYLDIRDLFTENINDLFSRPVIRLLGPVLNFLERFAVKSASKVNLVSPGFVGHLQSLDHTKPYSVFTNGIDPFGQIKQTDSRHFQQDKKEILYAGNIGEGQGLHRIIPGIAGRLDPSWRIRIIGDGGRREALEKSISGLNNVILQKPLPRRCLGQYYSTSQVLFLHLNDYPSFKKVLPSKLFEYAASGKPIIAGACGETAAFLEEEVENAVIFRPCDVDDFYRAFQLLHLEDTPRSAFCDRYQRSRIVNEMAVDILKIAEIGKRSSVC